MDYEKEAERRGLSRNISWTVGLANGTTELHDIFNEWAGNVFMGRRHTVKVLNRVGRTIRFKTMDRQTNQQIVGMAGMDKADVMVFGKPSREMGLEEFNRQWSVAFPEEA